MTGGEEGREDGGRRMEEEQEGGADTALNKKATRQRGEKHSCV